MKRIQMLIIPLALSLLIAGCKKDESDRLPVTPDKQTDQAASTEADEVMDQVKDVIDNNIGGGANKRVEGANLPCGVISIDSSGSSTKGKKIYKLNYGNKTKCGYKYKSGMVTFALVQGTTFAEKGATYSITFTDYKVEVNATSNHVTLNGTFYETNTTGGYVWQVVKESKTVQHKIRGSVTILFANNEIRMRNFYRSKSYSNNSSGWAGLNLLVAGDTIINGKSISETGKTFEGNYEFMTEISEGFSWSNCGTNFAGPYLLKKGKAIMHVTLANVFPANIEVEGGYYWNYTDKSATPKMVNDCSSNAYKITTHLGQNISIGYQLY